MPEQPLLPPTPNRLHMRLQHLLLSASLKRALLETLLLSAILWGGLFLLSTSAAPSLGISRVTQTSALLLDIICMLFYVARLRLPSRFLTWQTVWDAICAMGVSLLMAAAVAAYISISLPASSRPAALNNTNFPALIILVLFLANCTGYAICRVGARILLFWNKLRREHLLWALTHSHVMLVVIVAGTIIFLVDVVLVASSFARLQPFGVLMILPLTILLLIPSVIALMLIVPPFALFSYFVIRRTTDRLRTLMLATSSLRDGNYAVRVPVLGEDEVAHLQSDFNAMAADLEQTMGALQEERDRVAALLQERRQLIANVSHELRTPVATLRGYLETTLMHWDQVKPTTLHHDLQVMEDEVNHLQARVEDLFMLARAELGMLKLQCEPTDVGQLVQRIVDTRAPLAWRSSRIEVIADVSPHLPEALVDPRRLEQAVQNLLHNGLRHTSPGGIVAVVATAEPDVLVLQVKDTGDGIAPEDLSLIWERFYQTESARTRMGGGTGLGLALVKEWIEAMGGSVAVESVLDQGSCFTLRLPRASCPANVPAFLSQQSSTARPYRE